MFEDPFKPSPDMLRHEAGLRVRAFEREFQPRLRDPRARAAVLPLLQGAVGAFFSGRFDLVAKGIDAARRSIDGGTGPEWIWADAWAVLPERRLLDAAESRVMVRAIRLYDADVPAPATAEVRFGRTVRKLDSPLVQVDVPAVDAVRPVEIHVGGQCRVRRNASVARIRDLDRRLARLDSLPKGKDSAALTASASLRRLQALREGGTPENEFDAELLLGRVETLARTGTLGFEPGDWWVVLDTPAPMPARVFVPPGRREPRPVVVALHGAGGTENMFFDAYGAGRIVELCRRRGWLLVAPRTGLVRPGDVLSALGRVLTVDARCCLLVGHSMGAAAAIAGIPAAPGVFAAVAALGGGGRIADPDAWKGTRLAVSAGESDFALPSAKALHAS
ncbi:MAG: hypothetical protein ACKO5K_14360, partial [Armatimonadota bacterium]